MAKYTASYLAFLLRTTEVELLRKNAAEKEKTDAVGLRGEINALCRGGIVLLSAHLEAYIKDVGEELLVQLHDKAVDRSTLSSQFFFYLSQDMLKEVLATSQPDGVANKLFAFLERDADLWGKTGNMPRVISSERFNKGFSNPAFKKIVSYFNRFGYDQYRRDLSSRLKADSTATINMVDSLVNQRNKIAHGDPNATQTPSELKEMVSLIRLYCKTTDFVFSRWCRAKFCAIR